MRIEITPHAQTSSESIANPAEKPADPFSALLASLRAAAPLDGAPMTIKSREEQPTLLPSDLGTSSSIPMLPAIATSVATANENTIPDALTIRAPRQPAKNQSGALAAGKKRGGEEVSNDASREVPTVALPPALKAPVMPLTLSATPNVNAPAVSRAPVPPANDAANATANDAPDPSEAPTSRPQKRRATKELATATLQEATRDALRTLKQAPTQIAPMNTTQNWNATPNGAQPSMQLTQALPPQSPADDASAILARVTEAVRANVVTYVDHSVLIRDAHANVAPDATDDHDEANHATAHDASSADPTAHEPSASHDTRASNDASDDASASDEDASALFAITHDTLRSNTSEDVTMPAPPLLPPLPPQALSPSPSGSRSSVTSFEDDKHSWEASSTSPATTIVPHAAMPALSVELDVASNKTPEKPAEHARFTDALISNVERAVTDKRESSSFEVRAFDGTKVAVNVEMEGENVRIAFSFDAKHSAAETAVRASVGTLETKLGERGLSTVVSIAAFSDKRAASLAQVGAANGGSAASGFGSDTDDRNRSRGASYEALADLASSPRMRTAKSDDTSARAERDEASTNARRGWVA